MKKLIVEIVVGIIVFVVSTYLIRLIDKKFPSFFAPLKHKLGNKFTWVGKPWILIPICILVVLSSLYLFWLQNALFPEKRLVVTICTFSHNVSDNNQVDAWRTTKLKIQEALDSLKHEIKLSFSDYSAETYEESKKFGKQKKADLVVWGKIAHIDSEWLIEPHITLRRSLGGFESIVKEPAGKLFIRDQSVAQPSVIELTMKKAEEVNDVIYLVSGLVKYTSGDFSRAIDYFFMIRPRSANILVLVGTAFVHNSPPDLQEAENFFRLAAIGSQNYTDAWYNWGIVLGNLGKYEEEIQKYKKVVEIDSNFHQAYSSWGLALSQLGKNQEALEKFTKAIEIKPDYREAYSHWGVALVRLGKNEEAIEKFKKVVEIEPKHAMGHYNWGVALLFSGRNEEAIEKYKKAIKINPNFVEALTNWGLALTNLGEDEEAIKKLKKAVKIDPNFVKAYLNWATALSNLGKFEESIDKCKKAIAINPALDEAYTNWGAILIKLDSLEEAIDKFEKAVELNPNSAEAYSNWGVALFKLRRYDESMEKFQKSIKISPSYEYAHYGLGLLYLKLNRINEAEQELINARKIFEKKGNQDMITLIDELLKKLNVISKKEDN